MGKCRGDVVEDGSSAEHALRYRELMESARASATVQLLNLASTTDGHGPAYARNYGVALDGP